MDSCLPAFFLILSAYPLRLMNHMPNPSAPALEDDLSDLLHSAEAYS